MDTKPYFSAVIPPVAEREFPEDEAPTRVATPRARRQQAPTQAPPSSKSANRNAG